jgi:uncharacterized protein YbjT (DUF2867 family)
MGALSRLITGVVRSSMIKDKNDGEQLLRQSDLDWTISYPGRLTDAPATGLVEVLPEGAKRRITERISRADVAGWLVEAASSNQTSRHGIDITGGARTKDTSRLLGDSCGLYGCGAPL